MHSTTGGVQLISIHAPPRGATAQFDKVFQQIAISIHAPPRGATYLLGNGVELENITIHAPPRGATTRPPSFGWGGTDFNSRPSARGDVAALSEKAGISKFQFTPLREGRQSSDTP